MQGKNVAVKKWLRELPVLTDPQGTPITKLLEAYEKQRKANKRLPKISRYSFRETVKSFCMEGVETSPLILIKESNVISCYDSRNFDSFFKLPSIFLVGAYLRKKCTGTNPFSTAINILKNVWKREVMEANNFQPGIASAKIRNEIRNLTKDEKFTDPEILDLAYYTGYNPTICPQEILEKASELNRELSLEIQKSSMALFQEIPEIEFADRFSWDLFFKKTKEFKIAVELQDPEDHAEKWRFFIGAHIGNSPYETVLSQGFLDIESGFKRIKTNLEL